MQLKSTLNLFWSFCSKVIVIALIFVSLAKPASAQVNLINEGFDLVVPAGWAQQNLSNPVGIDPIWKQGIPAPNLFDAHAGPANSYALATYNNIGGTTAGTISNWLFTPVVLLTNGDVFSFWTRTVDVVGFPDRLQVRLSTNGASVDVGTTNTTVGDFTTVLFDINPTYDFAGYPSTWTLQSITISGLAAPVQGRIGFRYFVENGGPAGANSDNIGIDDVIYFQTISPVCSTPAPGLTIASASSVCPGSLFNLSIQNPTPGSGVTYQWYSSSAIGGPYQIISGATNNTYTTSLTASTYYQLEVTCNGTPVNSTPVLVALSPSTACYCLPGPQDCTFDDVITNVLFGGIDNTTDCSPTGYTSYTNLPAGAAQAGAPNPMSVTVGPGGNEYVGVWIDYNHDGLFGVTEYTALGNGNGATINGNINIPANALSGITGMRVRVRFNVLQPPGSSCTTLVYGETEDYNVDIAPCVAGTIQTQPTDADATCGNAASFTIGASGTAITYQWQERANATSPWTTLVDGPNHDGSNEATLTVSNLTSAMNGFQYRVVIEGGCTAIDFSNVANLTVNPLVIEVNPPAYSTCNPIPAGAPVLLEITTQNGIVVTNTQSFSSGPLNTTIPDGDDAGIINAIPVSIPAGAIISAASVKLNINHAWVGDLAIALKAPNGNVLNLDYGLTSTGGSGPTTGFTNTVISSTGTATLVSGTNPWTGIFKPDAPTAPGTVPTAPTSLSPTNANVFTFPDLYSVPSGDWTIGLLDYGGDPAVGTIVNWELTLTYSLSQAVPFAGVWAPTTGLFLDAAGTTPYAGTVENAVYAAPGSSTVYSVTVSNPTCPSDPTDVPVNILSPDPVVTITAAPYTSINPGLSSLLTATVTPALSAAGSYQWFYSGTAIPGATSSTFLADFANGVGEYSVDAIDPTICSGRVGASIILTDSASNTFFLWPNPSNGQFQVRYSDGTNDLLTKPPFLQVYDSKGSRLAKNTYKLTTNYGRMDVDLSGQPKGTYVVALYNNSGVLLKSGRVVIQ